MTETSSRRQGSTSVAPSPAVSVVIATRDRPRLLRQAISAALDQDYSGAIDVVVVYDRSDPDWRLPDEYRHGAVRVLRNTRTPGLAGARNTGVMAATGEWVAFCDDDDEWRPTKLRRQIARSDERTQVVVSGVMIEYRGDLIERVPEQSELSLSQLLRSRVVGAHPSTVLVRRLTLLDSIGLVDEDIPGSYGEDYEWLLRAARHADVAVVKEALVKVRWHPASYFADRWRTIIAAIDYLIAKVPEFVNEPRGFARLRGRQAFALAALGDRRGAMAQALRTGRLDWREPRAYFAILVALRLVSADRLLRMAHARGRGL